MFWRSGFLSSLAWKSRILIFDPDHALILKVRIITMGSSASLDSIYMVVFKFKLVYKFNLVYKFKLVFSFELVYRIDKA
jgi:hypothetical protein